MVSALAAAGAYCGGGADGGAGGIRGLQIRDSVRASREMVRNFYGALRVRDSGRPLNWMPPDPDQRHINHGEQFLNPARRDSQPRTTAGHRVGLAIREKGRRPSGGVIGLGTGTLAAYGRLGIITASTRSTRWCCGWRTPNSLSWATRRPKWM